MDMNERYLVSMEDGEIVKATPTGFESTGMFVVPVFEAPITHETLENYIWISENV